jgi:hypothetical protein
MRCRLTCCSDLLERKHFGWVLSRSWDVYRKRCLIDFETLDGESFTVPIENLCGDSPSGFLIVGNKEEIHASVAQLVEQVTCNDQVNGSNPFTGFRKEGID